MTDSLYLNSEDVHVFPYGSSRASDPLARVLNERNITTLVKNLTDEHSYVLFYKDGLIKFEKDCCYG